MANKFFGQLWKIDAVRWFIYLSVILMLFNVGIYYYTQFEKTIIVKDKYLRYRKGGSSYHIVADNGDIYQIVNLWFKGDFDRAEDYTKLEIGKTYKVKGYGYRFGMLDSYACSCGI